MAQRRARSRSTTKKFVWGVLALTLLAAVLALGSGTGGNAAPTHTNAVLPLVLLSGRLRRLRW